MIMRFGAKLWKITEHNGGNVQIAAEHARITAVHFRNLMREAQRRWKINQQTLQNIERAFIEACLHCPEAVDDMKKQECFPIFLIELKEALRAAKDNPGSKELALVITRIEDLVEQVTFEEPMHHAYMYYVLGKAKYSKSQHVHPKFLETGGNVPPFPNARTLLSWQPLIYGFTVEERNTAADEGIAAFMEAARLFNDIGATASNETHLEVAPKYAALARANALRLRSDWAYECGASLTDLGNSIRANDEIELLWKVRGYFPATWQVLWNGLEAASLTENFKEAMAFYKELVKLDPCFADLEYMSPEVGSIKANRRMAWFVRELLALSAGPNVIA